MQTVQSTANGKTPIAGRDRDRGACRSIWPGNGFRATLLPWVLLLPFACAACTSAMPAVSQGVNPADVRMQVSVAPTPPVNGQPATVNISLRTTAGAPVSGADLIVIEAVSSFTSQLGGMQPVTASAPEQGAGEYVASRVQFPSRDSWVITVTGHLADGGPIQDTFYTPGSPSAGRSTGNAWLLLNDPVSVTDASVAAGKALFQTNCTMCHGETGQGNGPAAVGLIPPPSDLSVHVPMHPEGMLWYWISNGISRSAMPAWNGPLSDSQLWDVVNYLRSTFPQPTVAQATPTPAPSSAGNGGVVMQLTVSPKPATLGPARIQVALKQSDGSPITNATLSIEGSMTGMSMAPNSAKLRAQGDGSYIVASYAFTMTGSWQLQITANLPGGQQAKQTFDVPVK